MIKLVTFQLQLLIYCSKWALSCTPLQSTVSNLQNRRRKSALAPRHRCLVKSVSSPVLSAAVAWFIPAPPVLGQCYQHPTPLQNCSSAGLVWAALHCKHLPLHETTSGESPECAGDDTSLVLYEAEQWLDPLRVRHKGTAVLCLPGKVLEAPGGVQTQ